MGTIEPIATSSTITYSKNLVALKRLISIKNSFTYIAKDIKYIPTYAPMVTPKIDSIIIAVVVFEFLILLSLFVFGFLDNLSLPK